jgi:serine/threonine protein kinase
MNGHDEERLRREIDVLRIVRHDSLLHLQAVYENIQNVHIVTDLIVGVPLITWLEQQGYLTSEPVARAILLDIAKGLAYLHGHGVIHRDVKLENVMVERRDGRLKARLIDYGLACFVVPGQRETEPVGTLKYAAPELIARTGYTAKADCWSLGVILYILLQGKVPFFGDSEQQIANRIQHKRLDFTSSKWASFSPSCLEVLTGLMRRKEASRLSAEEVLRSEWALEEEVEDDSEERKLPTCLKLHTPFQKR